MDEKEAEARPVMGTIFLVLLVSHTSGMLTSLVAQGTSTCLVSTLH